MQRVLAREADRTVDLMGDRRALFGGLRAADFRRHRLEEHFVVE